jgi:aryl-alcohol dehydrogenase-like predicted oxidoreductase
VPWSDITGLLGEGTDVMKVRQLGRFGPTVSAIGVGCASMSGVYGDRDDADSVATIHRALDLGVNLFDTADMYGDGHNEELVGRAISGRRAEVVLATKFGHVMEATSGGQSMGLAGINARPEYVRQACDASLRRLGVEMIDLYQLHRVDPDVPIEETVGALAELVQEGKIRFIGLSETLVPDLRRAAAVHPITSLQSEYSLFERSVEPDVLDACEELGIGFLPFAPLSRGLLGGGVESETKLQAGDLRSTGQLPRFAPENLIANAHLAQLVEEIAAAHGATPAQVALAWLLARRPWIVPIPGNERIAYLEENVQAPELELSQQDDELLDSLAARVHGGRYSQLLEAGVGVSPPLSR